MSEQSSIFDALGEEGQEYLAKLGATAPQATASAIKKAEELNIPLEGIKATGSGGKIVVGDVTRHDRERRNEEIRKKQLKAKQEKEEPEEYPEGRFVSYAGNRIEVPDRTMKLEDVRQNILEDMFPELTRENTDMLYNKEKNMIVPAIKGHKKGGPEPEQPIPVYRRIPVDHAERPVYHVIGNDGVYQVRHTQAGVFIARIEASTPLNFFNTFKLSVPRVPSAIIRSAIDVFRQDVKREWLINVIYNRMKSGYWYTIPNQEATGFNVEAEAFVDTDDEFVVLQIHSHGNLLPFFSKQDDADEIRTGLYAVAGNLDREPADMLMRFSCGGIFQFVPPESVVHNWHTLSDTVQMGFSASEMKVAYDRAR